MSWMDSWSRPSKRANFPPPLYLTSGENEVLYCHSCGRVMPTKKANSSASTSSPVKYCSERCRRTKPGTKDRQIEDAFVALLSENIRYYTDKHELEGTTSMEAVGKDKPNRGKGDSRLIVWCSDVESMVFGSRFDPEKTAGRKKNRTPRGFQDVGEWKSVDMEDKPTIPRQEIVTESSESEDSDGDLGVSLSEVNLNSEDVDQDHIYFGAGKRRPSQFKAQVNGSVGGEKGWAEKIQETDEMLQKRLQGQRRAEEKEMVRKAARRGVVFGFKVPATLLELKERPNVKGKKKGKGDKRAKAEEDSAEEGSSGNDGRKKCEAVITKAAIVVEPSYAKGDWGVRWREE